MKNTTNVFLICLLSFGSNAYSEQYNVILPNDKNEYAIVLWTDLEPETSEWSNSTLYDCEEWSPLLSDFNAGVDVEQTRTCKQEKKRTVQDRRKDSESNQIRNVGEPYEEVVIESVSETEINLGTYLGFSCLDILNKGQHLGTDHYLLSDGDVVFCEMSSNGGGYQLKTSYEYIPDGNLTDGTDVDLEEGSNSLNEIVSMDTPVGSFAVKQSGNLNTEYEIHPNRCDMVAGDYIAMTLWTDTLGYNAFHNRYWDINGTPSSEGVERGTLINQVVVNDKTWYQFRHIRPVPNTARDVQDITDITSQSCFSWYVGYGTAKPEAINLTGFSIQVYTK